MLGRIPLISKILFLLTISAALLVSSVSHAVFYYDGYTLKKFADADDRTDTGNAQAIDYAESSNLIGFIVGVNDSIDGILVCIPSRVKIGQLVGMVKKYVREHPDRWNIPANTLVIDALSSTFPCKK